ncbi:MAG: hypothetical protein OEV64_13530 [Desulfobulbaceae bacterium]|nr:hypothetical protein [Desulfobulbaceae bacterium]
MKVKKLPELSKVLKKIRSETVPVFGFRVDDIKTPYAVLPVIMADSVEDMNDMFKWMKYWTDKGGGWAITTEFDIDGAKYYTAWVDQVAGEI